MALIQKPHFIAEAGTNHGGNYETACRLVDIAKQSGADSVKFQIIYPEGLYLPKLFQSGTYVENEVFQIRAAAMLGDDEYRRLADYCRERDLPISASVFDERGLKLLDEFNPPYFKFASCDLNNVEFLKRATQYGRRMILSTGMASLSEIEQSVRAILSTGHQDVVLMHCVSIYPCPVDRMNINFLKELKSTFNLPVGLSDHTENSLAAAIAIGLGIEWLEKHFTYDRSADGFDHAYAMEPDTLRNFANDLNDIARALSDVPEKITQDEANVKVRARRGLYAARTIEPGETIHEADVLTVRPESAMRPHEIVDVIGKTATRQIHQFEAFAPDQLT